MADHLLALLRVREFWQADVFKGDTFSARKVALACIHMDGFTQLAGLNAFGQTGSGDDVVRCSGIKESLEMAFSGRIVC